MKIGVTGGIGSGKTSVCRVFNVLGIPVFSADLEARSIMDTHPDIITGITSITGEDLYSSGMLDRSRLSSLVFSNEDLLHRINSLVHPAVFERYRQWISEQTAPYTIMEAAILIESGAAKLVDRIVTVIAPVEERISRVVHWNKLSREEILERMKNQLSDDERIRLSHYIVNNSNDDMIIPAILQIHDDILKLIKN
jgi:dephospho-CoA kinase